MNKSVDENASRGINSRRSQFFTKTRIATLSKATTLSDIFPKPNINLRPKNLEVSKIIKLGVCQSTNFKAINIDFSKNTNLLDKLFEMKNKMKIKKKTFI
jgi:hypothetical protein